MVQEEFHSRQGFTRLLRASGWEVTQLGRLSTEVSRLSLGVYRASVEVGSVGVM